MSCPQGRAAALMALELALNVLQSDPAATRRSSAASTRISICACSATLDSEQRILGPRVMDGFIPGEGAAFFVLSGAGAATRTTGSRVVVNGAASAMDPGHRYGDAPARGEGLAVALEQARQRLSQPLAPIATTFAGFNGESFDAKLWGVARLRHNDFFSPGMVIEHPADKFGDAGAAMGAILIALAAPVAGERNTRRGRRWCGPRPIASRAPAPSCPLRSTRGEMRRASCRDRVRQFPRRRSQRQRRHEPDLPGRLQDADAGRSGPDSLSQHRQVGRHVVGPDDRDRPTVRCR